ncbi:hypothetical protein [Bacteroides sp.]|uniref:hypothetical protein n=1 Tax=Bacteroides sp. TaxID=29523 RepID=UPI0026176186|nr:hypothetical protein [Bacteroides sp.]MDD3036735.1 hypothetical protein [Bacteroides sp.]
MGNTDDPDTYLKIIRIVQIIIVIMLTLASLWALIIKKDKFSLSFVILGLCLLLGYVKIKRLWLRITVRIILIVAAFLAILNNYSLV